MREKRPDQVFTPRAATVNEAMYVERPELQVSLAQALRGTMHVVVHGESGTGKSWLYKHVFAKNDVACLIANMANAIRLGGLNSEFKNLVDRAGEAIRTGYTEKKELGLSAGLGSGKLDHTNTFALGQKEPFEACLQFLRAQAREGLACLVFDNLEHLFASQQLMSELASIIVLLDDPRYADYGVKILLVGVPNDIKRYFSMTPNLQTVANRLTEIPEVARLTADQTRELVLRGLMKELKYRISGDGLGDQLATNEEEEGAADAAAEDELSLKQFLLGMSLSSSPDQPSTTENTSVADAQVLVEHVLYVTDRIPQQVHEYSLELAKLAELNAGNITLEMMVEADRQWMNQSLTSNYAVIEHLMNARATTVGRRNQVLYGLGKCKLEDFRHSDIEKIIRREFPISTKGVSLNASQILGELAAGTPPIIKRTPKGDKYRFTHPKYRMVLRTMLRKRFPETVEAVEQRLIG